MDGAEVGVFEKTNHVGLGGFLESEDSGGLESEIVLELRSDFSYESLEGKFSDEEFSALLESSDFSESDCSGSESVGFLDTTSWLSGLLCLFVGDVLSWGLSTGVLSCSLFSSCHFNLVCVFKFKLLPLYFLIQFINPSIFYLFFDWLIVANVQYLSTQLDKPALLHLSYTFIDYCWQLTRTPLVHMPNSGI